MKVKLYDIIGTKSGMNNYLTQFHDLLTLNGIATEIKSNFETNGKKFFPYIFVKGPIKMYYLFVAYWKYLIDIVTLKKSDFMVTLVYGHVLDLPFLLMSYLKKNVIIDIHEVVSLDNRSSFINKMFKFLYVNATWKVISHSKKTDDVLKEFKFKNQILRVPLFHYSADHEIDMSKVGHDVVDTIERNKNYILFFGNIRPSKGITELLNVLEYLGQQNKALKYRIIIAGQDTAGLIGDLRNNPLVSLNTDFIIKYLNDHETDYLFKNCSYVLLPYKEISQSGVLEMAFAFKKPLIASRINYFKDLMLSTPSFGRLIDAENTEEFANELFNAAVVHESQCFYNKTDVDKYQKKEEFDDFVADFKLLQKN